METIVRQEQREDFINPSSLKKQQRKSGNPIHLPPSTTRALEIQSSSSWICKNSACRAVLSINDTFCKRCSCCICHLFDENKDPGLWLACSAESDEGYSCGSSCHLLCALLHKKVGIVDLGQVMQLDGSYCCASCGKVSRILGCWKKQLVIAKEARRVDVLCQRVHLAYRLFDGTARFKHMHDIVTDMKDKLESEVGPLDGISAKMARSIVSRLPIASEIHGLLSQAIEKADECLANFATLNDSKDDSPPPACRFQFQHVNHSSVIILLVDVPNASSDHIKGYKLWYHKSRVENQAGEPVYVLQRSQRRVLISNLQPCSEYTFRIISFTEAGDLGHSEAKCFTKSVEVIHKDLVVNTDSANENRTSKNRSYIDKELKKEPVAESCSDFRIRDLGKLLHVAWAHEKGWSDDLISADIDKCYGPSKVVKSETMQDPHICARADLDLNVVSVPDLNDELVPSFGCARDDYLVEGDYAFHNVEKNGVAKSHDSGNSHTQAPNGVVGGPCRKRLLDDDNHDSYSSFIAGPPLQACNGSSKIDGNFEYCVKIIRWLECDGYISKDFRLKLLTWFSLKSTMQERKIVNTFIHTLVDDPSSLVAQLVDSFSERLPNKKLRNGISNKI